MSIPDNLPVPCSFAGTFETTDESDAAIAEGATKKENQWCLVEMDKGDIAAMEAGQTFRFKEHSVRQFALCTQDKTWSLEFLENSNPMYLGCVTGLPEVKSADENKENKAKENTEKEATAEQKTGEEASAAAGDPLCTLFAQCRGNIFLKPWTGDAQKVRDLLTPPAGDDQPPRVTNSDLQYQVAASPKELKTILEDGPFIECDGAWQLLPAALERELIDTALCIITSQRMDEADVDGHALLEEMQAHYGQEGRSTVPSLKFLENALRSLAASPIPEAAAADKEKDVKEKEKDKGAAEKEKSAAEKDKGVAEKDEGSDNASAKPAKPAKPARPGRLALDAQKIKLFHATQILRQPPAEVRRRYDLPPPMPRAKRLRVGSGGGGAGRETPLQIEELCVAFKAVSGKETSVEELEGMLGDRMYVDELEGAVHPLDMASLPQEPRERLKRLFELSSHWKPERITALMAPAVKAVKVEVWLPKYTRQVFIEMTKGKEQRMITKKFAGMG